MLHLVLSLGAATPLPKQSQALLRVTHSEGAHPLRVPTRLSRELGGGCVLSNSRGDSGTEAGAGARVTDRFVQVTRLEWWSRADSTLCGWAPWCVRGALGRALREALRLR